MNKSIFSDRELLRQLSKGNTHAFKTLFDQYYPTLVRVLMRYSSDHEEIKDWVQEIYIKLWKSREGIQVDSIENFKGYFIVTARNFAIKAIARKKRLKLEQLDIYGREEIIDTNSVNVMEEMELRRAYQAAISRLPAKTRKAYVLSRETMLTYNGIATELGVSIKTIEAQISRAISLLRQELHVFLQ